MSDGMKISAKCLKGHEFVVTKDMVTVTKKGNAFTVRCPHIEDGRVCGAPAPLTPKKVAELMGIGADDAKRLMKEMHDRLYGTGQGVAPLTPPEPDEPAAPPAVDANGFTQGFPEPQQPVMAAAPMAAPMSAPQPVAGTIPAREMVRAGIPVTPHPERSPYAPDEFSDVQRARVTSSSVVRDKTDNGRKFPPIEVVEEKQPLEILREVIRDSGLKEDVIYTLQMVADLLPDGWTTDRFISDARYYGVQDGIIKNIVARFRLAWASHQKKLEEHRRMTERLDGPPLGPFGGATPNGGSGGDSPMAQPSSDMQYRQMTQQIGMQMLQGNPMMQMWAQSNPKAFEDMVKKIVEDTLKAQQQSLFPQLNPMAGMMNPMMGGMNPMMGGMNPMMGGMGGMTPFGNPMMGPMAGTMVYPNQNRERGLSEEKVKELVAESVSNMSDRILRDLQSVIVQMNPQRQQPSQDDTLLKTIVVSLLQNQNKQQPDPTTTMLLKHILESSDKGGVTEQMFLAILDELKKGRDSRYSGDIEELRELIKWKATEGELSLKQREFDEKREDRELWRKAMDDGLQVIGQALAVTFMSRGMGGTPIAPQQQQQRQTEALLMEDGSMGMKCPECKQLIIAPRDAQVVSCPFCSAVFPIVEPPDFGDAVDKITTPPPQAPPGGNQEFETHEMPEPESYPEDETGNVITPEVDEPVQRPMGVHY